MKKQLPAGLLNRYLNGLCNAQEEAIVKEWFASFANDEDNISSLNEIQRSQLKARMRDAITQNIATTQVAQPVSTSRFNLRYIAYSLTGIAALLFIVFGIKTFYNPGKQTDATAAMLTITNNTKTISEQVLSDGSHVWLYPGSSIRFKQKFSGAIREISMTGESFFDITKDASHPFIIHSKHLVTKVWGTSFRVRDNINLAYADVTVVTGKVSVKPIENKSPVKEVMLHPNDQVTWLKNQAALKVAHGVEARDLAIWKKINLTFDNKLIRDVLPVLNKQFNVNITTADEKINNYLLDADLNGLNLPSIMGILNKTLNISYEIDENAIVLKNNN